jgi:hypothetical protein
MANIHRDLVGKSDGALKNGWLMNRKKIYETKRQ